VYVLARARAVTVFACPRSFVQFCQFSRFAQKRSLPHVSLPEDSNDIQKPIEEVTGQG
jgi:hypothetical protein